MTSATREPERTSYTALLEEVASFMEVHSLARLVKGEAKNADVVRSTVAPLRALAAICERAEKMEQHGIGYESVDLVNELAAGFSAVPLGDGGRKLDG